jgi:hypothetical protein
MLEHVRRISHDEELALPPPAYLHDAPPVYSPSADVNMA